MHDEASQASQMLSSLEALVMGMIDKITCHEMTHKDVLESLELAWVSVQVKVDRLFSSKSTKTEDITVLKIMLDNS